MLVGALPALVGHLLTLAAVVGGLQKQSVWLPYGLGVQVLMFVLCLVFTAVELVRGDRGLALGFVLAWAAGVALLLILGCCAYGYAVIDARNPNGSW
jgi:hypothetical protein